MPKTGFTVITISQEVYDKIKETMNDINKKAGYRKFRSVAHFVEEAIMKYYQNEWQGKKGESK